MTETDFIAKLVSELKRRGIKRFPDAFCDLSDSLPMISSAPNLVLGKNFFGHYEVTATNGETVLSSDNLNKAKFIVYSSRNMRTEILIPKNETEIDNAVQKYESYLDQILNEIKKNFKNFNPDSKNIGTILSDIFMKLNLIRL